MSNPMVLDRIENFFRFYLINDRDRHPAFYHQIQDDGTNDVRDGENKTIGVLFRD